MTDEDLIAALGWEPCAIDTCQQWCAAHAMDYSGLDSDGPCCLRMYERLIGARAGIDLARNGIAEAIEQAYWGFGGAVVDLRAAEIAREWTP